MAVTVMAAEVADSAHRALIESLVLLDAMAFQVSERESEMAGTSLEVVTAAIAMMIDPAGGVNDAVVTDVPSAHAYAGLVPSMAIANAHTSCWILRRLERGVPAADQAAVLRVTSRSPMGMVKSDPAEIAAAVRVPENRKLPPEEASHAEKWE